MRNTEEVNLKITGSIVTYNNQRDIINCIGSILEYTKKYPIKLFISDNGSKDETLKLIQENFPEVIILQNHDNLGFGKAHNRLLSLIESDYHFIINPDIHIEGWIG